MLLEPSPFGDTLHLITKGGKQEGGVSKTYHLNLSEIKQLVWSYVKNFAKSNNILNTRLSSTLLPMTVSACCNTQHICNVCLS